MTPEYALAAIKAKAQNGKDLEMAAYHKIERPYLGTANPDIDFLVKKWRAELTLETRLLLCQGLWDSNIHEGQIAAAKLLTQARIRPDDNGAWALISAWVQQLDAWAIADHVASAAQKRIIANSTRLDAVEDWTRSENMWVRRAALVVTLPYAKLRNPKVEESLMTDRILGWAGRYVSDRDWFIQKAIAWWLRDLSKRDPTRTIRFLRMHGPDLKKFARVEAAQYLPQGWDAPTLDQSPYLGPDLRSPLNDEQLTGFDFDKDPTTPLVMLNGSD